MQVQVQEIGAVFKAEETLASIGIEVKTFQFGEHIHISDVLEGFVMQVEAIVHFRGGVVGSLIALA